MAAGLADAAIAVVTMAFSHVVSGGLTGMAGSWATYALMLGGPCSLLLTQTAALSYGWHLAAVAAENEPQPNRARALKGVSEGDAQLLAQAFNIKTVKDLGTNKFFLAAQAIAHLAE